MRWTVLALVGIAGCNHRVEVNYVQAAQVNLGKDVHKVLVVERVGAENGVQSFLDFTEGMTTGEGPEGDADTTASAVRGVVDVLNETGRFEVTGIRLGGRGVDDTLFGGQMAPQRVLQVCKKSDCDAIVSVDALDTDTAATITVERDADGKSFQGKTNTDLTATFRVYGPNGGLEDEQQVRRAAATSSAVTTNRAVAQEAIAETPVVQNQLAYDAGADYGRRISPHAVVEGRALYVSGSRDLKDAWKRVKDHDWAGAREIWSRLEKSDDAKVAAKARYDLAIANERRGKLDDARELAKEAAAALDTHRSRTYVDALDARIANEERVERQMAPTAPDAKP